MIEPARGVYDQVITGEWQRVLLLLEPGLAAREQLDPADAADVLLRHLTGLARRALRVVGGTDAAGVARQVELANTIASTIIGLVPKVVDTDDLIADSHDVLLAITDPVGPGTIRHPIRPEVPLSASALLVNGRDQPRIGSEIQRELASADEVDLLCAFVKWHGLRLIDEHLDALLRRGGRLRVITTTYIGATERRALDRLVGLGAQVKVSYETHTTRLHAKAWLFGRRTGLSTAYVGSSNLSKTALVDGLEWNVRLSSAEQPHLLDTFRATFDQYWDDPAFESYDPTRVDDRERLDQALLAERGGPADLPLTLTSLDVVPYPFQREVLDELDAERTVHGHSHNLVVMATGTGKTIVAALDYRRLREAGTVDSLLFVAHQDQILTQAQTTFRHVMRDGAFGERFVSGERPAEWRHVFASIQSLSRVDLEQLDPASFDMVIVDEFHHALAPTYERLLSHLQPKQLLGLTATPERTDGSDVRSLFGGRTAAELRLWEALERGLLAPFQYFGLHDGTDLRTVRWTRRSGYDAAELTNVLTGDDMRSRLILQALRDKVSDVGRMRAIGFCVSVRHAQFMAHRFNHAGIPALAITGDTPADQRAAAMRALRDRTVNVLFTVDLFNEGVDVPEIDTVLFLRPTESATVFLQQLGRGLRLHQDKPCLTALDFIGHQHDGFRFDLRYRALTGATRRRLEREVEHGFPTLPPGCHLQLDRQASEIVLRNVRASLRIDWTGLVSELRRIGDTSLGDFLDETGLDLDDVYRRRKGGWSDLRRQAGLDNRPAGPDDAKLGGAFGRMLHVDDVERLDALRGWLQAPRPPVVPALDTRGGRLLAMLHFALWGSNEPLEHLANGLDRLWAHPARRDELLELTALLRAGIRHVTAPLNQHGRVPLHVHGHYSRDEALSAFGLDKPASVRQGVKPMDDEKADLFFVTLRKTERHYSPTTMYADRAVTPSLFQWESQSTTTAASPTGQRYINHKARGWSVHLFIRESKEADGDMGAPPYLYAGPADYVSHQGDRPMRILWHLHHDLPPDLFHAASVAAG